MFESTRSEFDSLLDRLVKSELKNITQQGQIDFLKRSNNVFSSEIDNLANKKKQTSWYSWNSERLDQKSRVTWESSYGEKCGNGGAGLYDG